MLGDRHRFGAGQVDQPAEAVLRVFRAVRVFMRLPANALSTFGQIGPKHNGFRIPVRALLLQILFTIRSERLLMEGIDCDLLFRWFVGLGIDDSVWNHSVSEGRSSSGGSVRTGRG